MYDFTQKKFLGLPEARQHRKCAELLCQIYHKRIGLKSWEEEWNVYQQLIQWMEGSSLDNPTLKIIADLYHRHLKQASLSKKEHNLLPQVRTGDHIKGEAAWPIAIYLDHLRSAHNVGSIIRTVEAFSLGSLYFSSDTPFIDHKQVQDASMGAHQWISSFQGTPLTALPRPWIALETSDEAIPLYEFIFPDIFTLIVGNEEYGCSDEILSQADFLVEIPLRGRKNSLNVANAFAITAGEISRQKQGGLKIR